MRDAKHTLGTPWSIVLLRTHSVARLDDANAEPQPNVLNTASSMTPLSLTLICNFITCSRRNTASSSSESDRKKKTEDRRTTESGEKKERKKTSTTTRKEEQQTNETKRFQQTTLTSPQAGAPTCAQRKNTTKVRVTSLFSAYERARSSQAHARTHAPCPCPHADHFCRANCANKIIASARARQVNQTNKTHQTFASLERQINSLPNVARLFKMINNSFVVHLGRRRGSDARRQQCST